MSHYGSIKTACKGSFDVQNLYDIIQVYKISNGNSWTLPPGLPFCIPVVERLFCCLFTFHNILKFDIKDIYKWIVIAFTV